MEHIAAFPPRSHAPLAQRHSGPIPTHTVPGELHQIRAYNESIRTRLNYLDATLGPSVIDEVGHIKRQMKDSHRRLERLQQKAGNYMVAVLLEQATVEAWQLYRRLVALEARLKELELEPERLDVYVPTGVRRSVTAGEVRPSWFRKESTNSHSSTGSTSSSIPVALDVDLLEMEDVGIDEGVGAYDGGTQLPTYMMSGALPPGHSYVGHAGNRTVGLLEASSNYAEETHDAVPNGFQRSPGVNAFRRRGRVCVPPKLARTWAEVKQSCDEEERVAAHSLHHPDRRREGSTTSFFAAFSIMSGIDDPNYYLPRFHHIKIHEVKRLKEWLGGKNYLQRSSNISRTEKLLHLLFLLQDGLRFETIAVLFSRTPRQVQAACNEAFEGLLQMHSETVLPDKQPACDHLWRISHKYFNLPAIAQNAERYYGWWLVDVVKVLVTLNLYIGRYRQQGRVALSGEYFKWWEAFSGHE